jgi:NAD(P)H-hydrate epimerase
MGGVLGGGSLGNAMDGADAIVDGLFGTGLDRPIGEEMAEIMRLANALTVPRLALDVPSGLHANTGVALGEAIRADVTVTFAFHKLGLHTATGAALAGRVYVADIGVPPIPRGEPDAFLITETDARSHRRPRAVDVHKYRAGHVAILAGSPGKSGAALLAARGALRTGAGAVTIVTWPEVCDALAGHVPEIMLAPIGGDLPDRLAGKAAIVIGPGLGLDARARDVVAAALDATGAPCVLDADALSHFAGDPSRIARWGERVVLTPHAGELARMFGVESRQVDVDRFAWADRAATDTGAIVLLKGPRTLVARAGHPILINPTGGPALAVAGSGDVLAGVIGALLADHEPHVAAWLGAWLHGRAGDAWASAHGDRGLLAHEIADLIPAPT